MSIYIYIYNTIFYSKYNIFKWQSAKRPICSVLPLVRFSAPSRFPSAAAWESAVVAAPALPAAVVECTLCKTNGEPEGVYTGHRLKDLAGNVTCPILSAYVCSLCRATGARAHTARYCPLAGQLDLPNVRALMSSRMGPGWYNYTSEIVSYIIKICYIYIYIYI